MSLLSRVRQGAEWSMRVHQTRLVLLSYFSAFFFFPISFLKIVIVRDGKNSHEMDMFEDFFHLEKILR